MSTPIVSVSSPQVVITNNGERGNTWLSGTGAPLNTLGIDGDFYLDTTNVGIYYGPKSGGTWGTSRAFATPLTNYSSVTDPTASNDGTQGYTRGSVWINTSRNVYYVCAQNTTGAAVWVQALPVGSAAGGDLTGTFPTPTVAKINGVTISGTPINGQIMTATSGTTAAWGVAPGTYPSTGMIGGGLFSINNATSFNITAGKGAIVDYSTSFTNPTVNLVTIPAQIKTLSLAEQSRIISYWYVDGNGNVLSQATPLTATQRRSLIQLGTTAFVAGALEAVDNSAVYVPQSNNQVFDLMEYLGTFVFNGGCRVQPNGANLSINMTTGSIVAAGFNYGNNVNDPHLVTYPALTLAQFYRATRTSGSETLATTVDPTNYDLNGVITPVGGGTNTSTIQRVYLFPPSSVSSIVVAYDQTTYGSLSAAVNAAGFAPSSYVVNPDFATGTIVAYICMTRVCTSLQDTTNCQIISAGKFANP